MRLPWAGGAASRVSYSIADKAFADKRLGLLSAFCRSQKVINRSNRGFASARRVEANVFDAMLLQPFREFDQFGQGLIRENMQAKAVGLSRINESLDQIDVCE